ncbi:MAG: SGNH hydrolase domain-containing protein, partial [Hyphomicrobiales bacterium]
PDFVETWRYGQCFYGSKLNSFSVYDKDECLRIDSSRKNVLLIGDSHAAHWYFALKKVFPEANILQATASGCRPLLDTGKSKRCTDLRDFIFDEFLPQNSVDTIILSARWREDEIERQLVNTLDFLTGFSKEIYVFGPTIEYSESLPFIYLRKLRFSDEANMQRAELNSNIDRWIGRESFSLSDNTASRVSETSAKYISIVDLVCPNNKCLSLTPEGKLINFDSSHFTLEGSEYLVEKMKSSGILAIE